jgi:hypothetical protein
MDEFAGVIASNVKSAGASDIQRVEQTVKGLKTKLQTMSIGQEMQEKSQIEIKCKVLSILIYMIFIYRDNVLHIGWAQGSGRSEARSAAD